MLNVFSMVKSPWLHALAAGALVTSSAGAVVHAEGQPAPGGGWATGIHGADETLDGAGNWSSLGGNVADCGGDYPVMVGASSNRDHRWTNSVLCDAGPDGMVLDYRGNLTEVAYLTSPLGSVSLVCSEDTALIGLSQVVSDDYDVGRIREYRCVASNKRATNCTEVSFANGDANEDPGSDDWAPGYNSAKCGPGRFMNGLITHEYDVSDGPFGTTQADPIDTIICCDAADPE
jgi:hypothetical protein